MRIIKVTEQNAHYWHRKLWNWIAENPTKRKKHWPGWKYVEECEHDCFACVIAKQRSKKTRCARCPIVGWGHNVRSAPCEIFYEYGTYLHHMDIGDYEVVSEIAKVIANKEWECLK